MSLEARNMLYFGDVKTENYLKFPKFKTIE